MTDAKIVMDGPCPHCGYIPLREENGATVCDGCNSSWPVESGVPADEPEGGLEELKGE